MAENRFAPTIFAERGSCGSPTYSYALGCALSCLLSSLDFSTILGFTNVLQCASLFVLLLAAVALRLRHHRAPSADFAPAFELPGGRAGFGLMVASPLLVVCAVIGIQLVSGEAIVLFMTTAAVGLGFVAEWALARFGATEFRTPTALTSPDGQRDRGAGGQRASPDSSDRATSAIGSS